MRDALGEKRDEFPQTMYLVTGTQAAEAQKNQVGRFAPSSPCIWMSSHLCRFQVRVMRVSNIPKTKQPESEDDDSDDEEDEESRAELDVQGAKHMGGVNRVRVSSCLCVPLHFKEGGMCGLDFQICAKLTLFY